MPNADYVRLDDIGNAKCSLCGHSYAGTYRGALAWRATHETLDCPALRPCSKCGQTPTTAVPEFGSEPLCGDCVTSRCIQIDRSGNT